MILNQSPSLKATLVRFISRSCPLLVCKKTPKKITAEEAFRKHEIVPDVFVRPPKVFAKVCFPSGYTAKGGNVLTPTQVKDKPVVQWKAVETGLYFLCMIDPDAPSRKEPTFREWNHWMVGNIPGVKVSLGQTLAEFIPSAPPQDTGLHRYVFLVFRQPMELDFEDVPRLTNKSAAGRGNFKIMKFSDKFSLGKPVAGNFYLAEYDDHVPKVYKSLGEN